MSMGSLKGLLNRKMKKISGCFWIFLSKLMQILFWVFTRIFMSPEEMNIISHEIHQTESSNSDAPEKEAEVGYSEYFENTKLKSEEFLALSDTLPQESNQNCSNDCKIEVEPMKEKNCSETITNLANLDLEEEKEEPTQLVFKFQYQSWNCNYVDELQGSNSESSDFSSRNTVSASTNKYEFISGNKSVSQFLEETEASNFSVKELYVHSNDSPLETGAAFDSLSGFSFNRKLMPENCSIGGVNAEIVHNYIERVDKEEKIGKLHAKPSIEEPLPENDQVGKKNFLSDDDFICSSCSESDSGDGFLSEADFVTSIELLKSHDEENAVSTAQYFDFEESNKNSENFDVGDEPDDFAEEDEDKMKEPQKHEQESGKSSSQSSTSLDIEDFNGFDTLWEHQDLIEQLKMELKKVRATGLPTILEDSESPRIMEDLKPWKIDEKFQHGSTVNELPKFYRSYRERMRKFDILNYQKMYAIGFLQSKDPLESISSRKNSSTAAITCILPRNFRIGRRKKSEADPMEKFIRELYCDLEMVYVGQLCLSWEFLRWEYEKALDLWESDQYGLRRYNDVAGEFQQFQVLLQRFIENEPFQGRQRVENYVRNRCAMRNLLQVPVIREDNAKDKKKFRKLAADEYAITSDMLIEILEESIRTIWRFIRADKDASSLTLRSIREIQELQDPSDSELLAEIHGDLQKKEKRIRELLRSESCILKKLQKRDEDETDHVLYFFSQVDMKLVWRVLNMSKITTDQLVWCRSKLNKINFVNRKINVEPSFLLFPSL